MDHGVSDMRSMPRMRSKSRSKVRSVPPQSMVAAAIHTSFTGSGVPAPVVTGARARLEGGFEFAEHGDRNQHTLGTRKGIKNTRVSAPEVRIGGRVQDEPADAFSARGRHRRLAGSPGLRRKTMRLPRSMWRSARGARAARRRQRRL